MSMTRFAVCWLCLLVIPSAVAAQPTNGEISGVAFGGGGQPLVTHEVTLERITTTVGGLDARASVATTATDESGQFSFAGLSPGSFSRSQSCLATRCSPLPWYWPRARWWRAMWF